MDITGNWSAFWAWSGSRRSWPAGMAFPGRPPCERAVLARAFIAKAVFNIPTTSLLIEMLSADKDVAPLYVAGSARARCRAIKRFRRAFRGVRRERFAIAVARGADPRHPLGSFGGHISRDSTAIEAPEKPAKSDKPAASPNPKLKRGRPARESSARRRRRVLDRTPTGHDIGGNAR